MEKQNLVLTTDSFKTPSTLMNSANDIINKEVEKFEKMLPKDASDYDHLPKNYKTLARKAASRLERLGKKAASYYGDVPVFYGGHKPKDQYTDPSISEQINSAKTAEEVETALKRGMEFTNASPKTIRKWKEAAIKAASRLADSAS